MIFFDPTHGALGKPGEATQTFARLGRKTDLIVPDEQIDKYLSSLPPPVIYTNSEKLLKRKNELLRIFVNYTITQYSSLVSLKKHELKELKDSYLDTITNTKKRTIKINGEELPLHINGRISAMFILSELYEHYLEPEPKDLKLLLSVLDDDINFPVCGKDFHRDSIENPALLKSMIAIPLVKAALQLEDPLELQFLIIGSLQKTDKMLEEELQARASTTLSDAHITLNKAIFITAYYYNQSVAKKRSKRLKPLPEELTKNSLKILSMDAERVLNSENLQP